MANYFLTIAASDACIDFICQHPETLEDFVVGTAPQVIHGNDKSAKASLRDRLMGKGSGAAPTTRPPAVPHDWPTEEAELVTEINHRNVDLYHWILNGSPDFVEGVGSIFQTWLTRKHAAIDLTGDREHFAFHSDKMTELSRLFAAVSRDMVTERFRQWLNQKTKGIVAGEYENELVWKDFTALNQQIAECTMNGVGLIWVFS